MGKLKLFIQNFFVYGLGGVISKIIPLIMVPIVTRLMPDSTYFGLSDLSNTALQFGSALAVMGMYDAMYRMFFEKDNEEYKKNICSTALMFTIGTSCIVFILMLLCKNLIAQLFFGDKQYAYLVYITAIGTLVGATNTIISAPTRMQNQKKIFLITNTISPILSYAISIPMLLAGHYLIALPLAAAVSGLTMEVSFGILNQRWFSLKRFDFGLLRQMLVIAVPLLPNFLIYWIFNSSDRLMVLNLMNGAAVGIYSAGAKLGNVSQLIYTAFAGGWQYFAFSTMKEEHQVESNSKVFEYLGVLSFTAGIFMCAWSCFIFRILFAGDYVQGYVVAPYLFMAPLLQMLFQIACNQFLVIKKTWPNMLILFGGAGVNVILNLVLIPRCGIEGAAIATLTGYIVSDIICVVVLCKMQLMVLSGRFLCSVLITGIYFAIWRLLFRELTLISTLLGGIVTVIFILLYKQDFMLLLKGRQKRNV